MNSSLRVGYLVTPFCKTSDFGCEMELRIDSSVRLVFVMAEIGEESCFSRCYCKAR